MPRGWLGMAHGEHRTQPRPPSDSKASMAHCRFLRVSEVANTDAALTGLIAFLVALTTVKLWTLLRLSPRMHLITRTLQKAWDEILQFLLTLLVLLTAYAFAVRCGKQLPGGAFVGGPPLPQQGHSAARNSF